MNNIVGINDKNMRDLILDIYEYRDRISSIINDAQNLVDGTKGYYSSEDGDILREKFSKFSYNNKILLNNIISYGEDLEKVMFNFKKNDQNAVDIFKK